MKPEASTLSTAILLISAGESVTEVLKIIEKEVKEIGISLRLGVVPSTRLECRLEGNDLNIDVSDKVGDVTATRDLAISTLATLEIEVSDGFLDALKQCDIVVRFFSDDNSEFVFEGGQAVVYVRPKLTSEFEPFREIVNRISDTFRGFVYDPSIGSAYTTKAGFGPRKI
jgi:hypothetical protein